MQRKITLTIDDDLIQKARVLAARRNRSVSALLREELTRLVTKDEAYETAKRTALECLERGSHLGGPALPEARITIVAVFAEGLSSDTTSMSGRA